MNNNLFIDLKEEDDDFEKALSNVVNGESNSGFELKDEMLLESESLANQFPQMNSDIFVAVENYIHRLIELDDRIKVKGISRGISYELLELIPSLENIIKPHYFTETPTNVNIEISNESISRYVWTMIAAASSFLLSILLKIIQKRNTDKFNENVAKNFKEYLTNNTKVLITVRDKLEGMENLLLTFKFPSEIDKDEAQHFRIPNQIKEEILRGKKECSVKAGDLIFSFDSRNNLNSLLNIDSKTKTVYLKDSKAYRIFLDSINSMKENSDELQKRAESLEKIFDYLDTRKVIDVLKERKLNLNEEYLNKPIYVGSNIFKSFLDWHDYLIQESKSLNNVDMKVNNLRELMILHIEAMERMSDKDYADLDSFIQDMKDIFVILEKIHRQANLRKKQSDETGMTDYEKDLARELFARFKYIKADVDSVIGIKHFIDSCFASMFETGKKLSRQLVINTEFVTTALEKFNKEQLDEFRKLSNELREDLKIYKIDSGGIFGNIIK